MNSNPLQHHHIAILDAPTVEAFRGHVIRFAQRLEFATVNAMLVVDNSSTHTSFHCVDNTPDAFRQRWLDLTAAQTDPVMQHCKHSSVPIVWDQATYLSKQRIDLWEEQAAFGFKTGICLALHLSGGVHFCLGVDRDRRPTRESKMLARDIAELQLFAVHAQVAALRIFAPQRLGDADHPGLTPRELEALRWTMDGELTWGVGKALNISEQMAQYHLDSATRKLGCGNKFQAVLKAIRLGLLT